MLGLMNVFEERTFAVSKVASSRKDSISDNAGCSSDSLALSAEARGECAACGDSRLATCQAKPGTDMLD